MADYFRNSLAGPPIVPNLPHQDTVGPAYVMQEYLLLSHSKQPLTVPNWFSHKQGFYHGYSFRGHNRQARLL